jgi:predicted dehydrogenase
MRPYTRGRLDWPGWYLIWDYCAGFIVNWGVHHLDIALWGCPALGRERFQLTCKASYRDDGLSDNVNGWRAEYRYASGLRMTFSDTGHPNAQGCRFEGDQGRVHVNRGGIHAKPASLLSVRLRPTDLHLHESTHHQGGFVESIKSRREPVAPVEAGHRASYFGMIADIAARLDRRLEWDPAAERFLGDDEANRMLTRPMRAPWAL